MALLPQDVLLPAGWLVGLSATAFALQFFLHAGSEFLGLAARESWFPEVFNREFPARDHPDAQFYLPVAGAVYRHQMAGHFRGHQRRWQRPDQFDDARDSWRVSARLPLRRFRSGLQSAPVRHPLSFSHFLLPGGFEYRL